jgi:DNA invertase Pin-like site-specific DNA recombinase
LTDIFESVEMSIMKAAIYLRVSTDKQTTAAQRGELREICKRRGWNGVVEYEDVASGAKFTRVGLDRMMTEIRRGRLDVVLCYKLDRLGRSLVSVAQLIGEMLANKVALVIPGQGIDTSSDNSAAKLQMNILMAVAEFERDIIRERTLAGLAAARARGAKLGRPPLELSKQAAKTLKLFMKARGSSPRPSYRSLAAELEVSLGKAHALIRGLAERRKPVLRQVRK